MRKNLHSLILHPLVMIALVAAVTLFGRVLPTWTLSLATIAASNALIALGIVVLARTGNVSFGQGLFFAAGGYGVALIANVWGVTDAVAQMIIGAVCGGLLGLVIGPDRKSTRLNSSHTVISYAVFCLKKKTNR